MASLGEDIYDFDAPQHYFDFKDKVNEEPDDSYFDCQEGSGPFKLETPQVEKTPAMSLRSSKKGKGAIPKRLPLATLGTPKSRPIPEAAEEGTPKIKPIPEASSKKAPTPRKPIVVVNNDYEQMEDKENDAPPSAEHAPQTSQTRKNSKISPPSVGVRSSPRLVGIAKALRRTNAARRSAGSGTRRSTGGASGSNLSVVNKQKTQNKPSVPKVSNMKGLNERDLVDLKAIANFRQKIVKNKKRAGEEHPRIAPTVPQAFNFATDTRLRQKAPVEVAKPSPSAAQKRASRLGPTKPQEFHFATESRVRKQSNEQDEESVTFPQFLRSGSSVMDKELPKGPTIPQPFKLTESRKGSASEASEENKFVSVAELNLKFHTRTPQRFRSKRTDESDESPNKRNKNSVTIPVTPSFATRTRSRKVSYLTREEMEQKEFEEEQKHKFKANPINKKVFEVPRLYLGRDEMDSSESKESGHLSMGNPFKRKQSTIPQPFNITQSKKEAPLGDNFKEMCNKLGCSTSSIASLPWGGVPSKWEKTNTIIKPFSFDDRDKGKLQHKQERIKKTIDDEKKLAEFQALPMPVFEDGIRGVPTKKLPTPTRVKPFSLRSDQRGELKREQFQRTLEEEQKLDKERRAFYATSDAVVHKEPFIPEKSSKPLTDISGFTLNTEVRAEARTEFEMHQKQKEDELLGAKREHEDRQAAEEAAEIARLRREVVHKANPVRNYKPVEIKPAPVGPTVPISPIFATKARLRSRMNHPESANSTMNISSATFTSE